MEYIGTNRNQPYSRGAQRGEATGEVFCPLKLAHIAEMRCGEYQELHGCQFRCPHAVTASRLAELKKQLRVDEPEETKTYVVCASCGKEKPPTPSPLGRCCSKVNLPHFHSGKQAVAR